MEETQLQDENQFGFGYKGNSATSALEYSVQNGISGDLLNILLDFVNSRKQRVVFNGSNTNWVDVKAGLPQGSIMGALIFLIYINNLPEGLITKAKLFTDDASFFFRLFQTSQLVPKNSIMT